MTEPNNSADAKLFSSARHPVKLREVYLTTVHAGFPRALNAATALKEVFDERDKKAQKK